MRVAIVGGGPAGLAAAYRLGQQAGCTVHLLERAPGLGGLAAGFRHGNDVLDYGPHRLHRETNPEVLTDLRRLLGAELRPRRRRGRIWVAGRYLPYPVGPATIARLPPGLAARLLGGAIDATLRRGRAGQPGNFREAVEQRVGRPLYDLFYGPYAEKAWGLPGEEISADQADRRVNQRGPGDLLRAALGRNAGSFYYPDGGFGRIPAAYAEALGRLPAVDVQCRVSVETVEWAPGRAVALTYRRDGVPRRLEIDHLIWSAPVTALIECLRPAVPAGLIAATGRLRFRAIVLAYVTLSVPRVGLADTYYFPEREFPFNRVIEQKNFSEDLVPPDRTVLGLDIACNADDAVYSAPDSDLAALVIPGLKRVGLVKPRQVLEVFSRRFRQAYPVYSTDYQPAWQSVLDWLDGLENIWPIGRQGLFLHNNTHHSLLMGYRAADAIAGRSRATWPAEVAAFNAFRVAD